MIDWSQQRILVVAPHPDDETLGCGGLISRAKRAGAKVFVQIITVGDTDEILSPDSTADQRRAEIHAVAEFSGWDGWEIVLPGNEYHLRLDQVAGIDLIEVIERRSPLSIEQLRPSVVVGPHRDSYNQDHRKVAKAMHSALRPSNRDLKHHPAIALAYEQAADQWSLGGPPPPSFLVALDEQDVTRKIEAMRLYRSQSHAHPHTRSDLTLRSLTALRGMQGGVPYAEAFHLIGCLT